ncbi:MAG TPA: hypothetical protein VGJ87_10145 [Roseiflexaceae bacterium]|jgi:hypothetical protein
MDGLTSPTTAELPAGSPSYRSADLRDRLERLVVNDILGPAGGPEWSIRSAAGRG